jgi:DNA-binding PadR family transcriptional regulator
MHSPWDHDWSREMKGRWGRGPWSGGGGRAGGDLWSEMWSEWWRGPAPRCERGLVRYLLLDALSQQPRHGYEIIQYVADRTGGAYKPSPGVVYPTLQMLEELGHARTVAQGERKTYEITEEGRRDLREHSDEVAEFYAGSADVGWEHHAEDVAHVMKRVGHVIHVFKRAMRRGRLRPATMRKMKGILDEALGKLEELLGEEEP